MRADDRGSTSDFWSVLLGVAVVALTSVNAVGWIEMRRLGERIGRLEGATQVGGVAPAAPSPGAGNDVGPQFTRLSTSISIRDSAFRGNPAASIVIVEFSDFECPFCARHFRDTFKRIEERYIATGKVRYVFRHLPLQEIHPRALMAAEVAECSRRQGLFWEIHHHFFANQRALRTLDLGAEAGALGVERSRLDDCLRQSSTEHVLADLDDARSLGIAGTPLFFVGRAASSGTIAVTHSINGARPFEIFESVLTEIMGSHEN